jgi:hypothetical protein
VVGRGDLDTLLRCDEAAGTLGADPFGTGAFGADTVSVGTVGVGTVGVGTVGVGSVGVGSVGVGSVGVGSVGVGSVGVGSVGAGTVGVGTVGTGGSEGAAPATGIATHPAAARAATRNDVRQRSPAITGTLPAHSLSDRAFKHPRPLRGTLDNRLDRPPDRHVLRLGCAVE